MSSINDKLKAAVKESLSKAEQRKIAKKPTKKKSKQTDPDEPVAAKMDAKTREYLGIPKYDANRPKDICVYMITYHPRATLDHVKYPNARTLKLENSPVFVDWNTAHKWCISKEKECPENIYFAQMTWIPEPQVPKDIMKKIIKRGW